MFDCERCNRCFPHRRALDQHKRDSNAHWVCVQCNIDFEIPFDLKEHWVQSPRHYYCQYCNKEYDSLDGLVDHYPDYHANYCQKCRLVFKDAVGLEDHYKHSENHYYCAECERDFQSENNLRTSSVHKPRTIPCPFHLQGCKRYFVTRSALAHHLENGHCSSGVDRDTVNRVVRQFDRQNVITDPSRLITDSDNDNSISRGQWLATENTWNGSAYECYFCHETFHHLNALNQHLNSPVHDEKVYFCPLSSCRVKFTTLSGLGQHIESEKCGVSRFEPVKNALVALDRGVKALPYSQPDASAGWGSNWLVAKVRSLSSAFGLL